MNPETDAYTPGERVTLAAEAVLLRAELADHRDERRADLDWIARMRQPATDETDSAALAHIENAEDLAILDRAVALVDQSVDLIERPTARLTPHLAWTLGELQAALFGLEHYDELLVPLDALGLLVAELATAQD